MISLPDLILLDEHGGDWNKYLGVLYQFFCSDFIKNKTMYNGRKLGLKKYPKLNGKEATFWHIISEGKYEDQKIPEMRRCERIRWPKVIIENNNDTSIKVWKNNRGNETNICLCYGNWEYIVILRERPKYTLFWTAYPLKYSHTKRKMKKEYEKFIKKANIAV